MAGSDIIATGTSNPNFYAQKMAALGDTVASFAAAHRQRKAQADAQAQAEIESAFKLMAQYPELADSWGESLKAKYGTSHPEVAGLVDVVKNRRALADEIPAAGRKWEGAWGDLESRHAADQQALQAMPDWTQVSAPMSLATSPIFSNAAAPPQPPLRSAIGDNAVPELSPYMAGAGPQAPMKAAENVTLTLPNAEKLAKAKQLAQVNPDMFPVQALGKLSPAERLRANVYAKSMGYDVPDTTVLDRLKMLPEKARAQEMIRLGMIPEGSDTADVIAYENKLKLAPATREVFDHEDEAQEAKHDNRLDELETSDELQTARLTYADSLRVAAHDRTVSGQKEIIDYRESKRPAESDGAADAGTDQKQLRKSIVVDSKTATSDWDARARAALVGLEGKARERAIARFEAENGKRPVPVPEVVANRIAAQIAERKLSGDDALEASIRATSAYMAERKRGASLAEASRAAIAEIKDPEQLAKDTEAARARKQAEMAAAKAKAAGQAIEGLPGGKPAPGKKAPPPAAPGQPPAAKAAPAPPPAPAQAVPPTAAKAVAAPVAKPDRGALLAKVKAAYPKASAQQQQAIVDDMLSQMPGGK